MYDKNRNKTVTLKIFLILSVITMMMLIPGGMIPVHATPGDVSSTIEINDSTENGPILNDWDDFGISVSSIGDLDGDGVNDIAVGAHRDDEGGTDRGTVHIILLNNDGTPKSTVEINDTTENGPILSNNDWFGSSVANIGDLDGDGVNDIAVGASYDTEDDINRGAIHIIFLNTDGTPKSTVEINDTTENGPIQSNGDGFGSSVTNIGDLDNDGINDIAVGAQSDDEGGTDRGTIHIIFLNTDGTPKNTVKINDSTENGPILSNNDWFGSSVANIGDLDGDGINDIAVGAHGDNTGVIHIIFLNTDGTPKSTIEINDSTINGPILSNNDNFGISVSSIGDLDGDGINDIAVGAHGDDTGGSSRGVIHIIFLNTDGTPKNTVKINDSTINGPILSNNDWFGSSITNIGDLDGNGVTDIAVGAHEDDTGGSSRGVIHIIFLNTDGTHTPTITSLVANDPDNLDNVYSHDDIITITFDSFTNTPGDSAIQTRTAVNDLYSFTEPLGKDYTGQWTTQDTFVITIIDPSESAPPIIGHTTVTPTGITQILSDDGTSGPSTIVSSVLSGDFGFSMSEELFCGEPESYYNVIYGTESSDYLLGTNNPDLILGNGGNDTIYVIGDDNCIYAGDGDDFVLSHKDGNIIYGGAGNDSILLKGTGIAYGEDGDDAIHIIKPSTGHLIDGGNGNNLCTASGDQQTNNYNCEITVP